MKREQIEDICNTINRLASAETSFSVFINRVCLICYRDTVAECDNVALTLLDSNHIKCSISILFIEEVDIYVNYVPEYFVDEFKLAPYSGYMKSWKAEEN